VDPHTTVIIPFDFRVIFVCSLNCAEFSSRLSEGAQPLNAISGGQFLLACSGLGERRPLGAVRVRSRSGMRQRRLGSFRQLGYRIAGKMSHIPLSLSKKDEERP
jgi:hypothetical protein